MSITVEDKLVAHERLGLVLEWCMGMFYADYGLVESRDPEWLQVSFNIIIGLFQWY